MAQTQHIFPQFSIGEALGNITLGSGTWKVALGNAAGPITLATAGISTAKLLTDWTAIVAEITGTGYTAGGVTVVSPGYTLGGTSNSVATYTSGTNPSWPGATFTGVNQAVLYQSSASTYQLACFWDFGGSISVTAQTFLLSLATGFFTDTVS